MSKQPKITKVLKKNSTRLSGNKVPVRAVHAAGQHDDHHPQAKAQVLSVEDGVVIIQVTCGCGEEIQLRCATGPVPGRPARPAPAQPAAAG